MDQDFDIVPFETSDKVRNVYSPYIQLKLGGDSYLNEKAAKLLGFTHFSLIKFHTGDNYSELFISSDSQSGALIRKKSGLYKFCDTNAVRTIFKVLNIQGTRANFPLSESVEEKRGPNGVMLSVVFIIPKPYNIE